MLQTVIIVISILFAAICVIGDVFTTTKKSERRKAALFVGVMLVVSFVISLYVDI